MLLGEHLHHAPGPSRSTSTAGRRSVPQDTRVSMAPAAPTRTRSECGRARVLCVRRRRQHDPASRSPSSRWRAVVGVSRRWDRTAATINGANAGFKPCSRSLLMATLAAYCSSRQPALLPCRWAGVSSEPSSPRSRPGLEHRCLAALVRHVGIPLLLGIIVWMLLAHEAHGRPLRAPMLATLAAWTCIVRPTNVLVVIALGAYLSDAGSAKPVVVSRRRRDVAGRLDRLLVGPLPSAVPQLLRGDRNDLRAILGAAGRASRVAGTRALRLRPHRPLRALVRCALPEGAPHRASSLSPGSSRSRTSR